MKTKALSLNPDKNEFETMQRQAKLAVISQLLPDTYKGSPQESLAKATVIAMKGRELGVPMMQAFSHIHIIKGKPSISSELMLALIYKNVKGAVVHFKKLTSLECIVEASRDGKRFTDFSFTMQDAETAGIARSNTWKQYPRAMLRSRCISEVARAIFPDAIMGCSYTPEELGEEPTDIVSDEKEVAEYGDSSFAEEQIELTKKLSGQIISQTTTFSGLAPGDSAIVNLPDTVVVKEEIPMPGEPPLIPENEDSNIFHIVTKGQFAGMDIQEVESEKLISWLLYMEEQGYTNGIDYKKGKEFIGKMESIPF